MKPYWFQANRSPMWAILHSRISRLLEVPDPATPWDQVDWSGQPCVGLLARQEDRQWLMRALAASARIVQKVNHGYAVWGQLPAEEHLALYKEQLVSTLQPMIVEHMMGDDSLLMEILPGTGDVKGLPIGDEP